VAGGLLCAIAAAEYRTATITRVFLISNSLSFASPPNTLGGRPAEYALD
jgi:hypothetical protein